MKFLLRIGRGGSVTVRLSVPPRRGGHSANQYRIRYCLSLHRCVWHETQVGEFTVNQSSQTVHVALDESAYNIRIGTGILAQGATDISATLGTLSHVVVISDANVDGYACQMVEGFKRLAIRIDQLTVAAGETSKSSDEAVRLWNQLLERGADRSSVIVAIGGGVVGDLAGFIAATFVRGIRFCQVPTTLLSQVDSSVGGKTGINLPGAKNMVGAFWQPGLVLIDTDVLNTLPDRDYASGLAEVVKYGAIMDEPFFDQLESSVEDLNRRDSLTLQKVIARCCRLKADVVEEDERETSGRRAILNYGHTFAHALEATAGYGELLHGEAVAIGMVCASRLAEQMGRISANTTQRQISILDALNLPTQLPRWSHQRLWEAMNRDKKVQHGKLRFVLPTCLGHVELVSGVTFEQVDRALSACH